MLSETFCKRGLIKNKFVPYVLPCGIIIFSLVDFFKDTSFLPVFVLLGLIATFLNWILAPKIKTSIPFLFREIWNKAYKLI